MEVEETEGLPFEEELGALNPDGSGVSVPGVSVKKAKHIDSISEREVLRGSDRTESRSYEEGKELALPFEKLMKLPLQGAQEPRHHGGTLGTARTSDTFGEQNLVATDTGSFASADIEMMVERDTPSLA